VVSYQSEMQRIEQEIAELGGGEALTPPIDPARVTQYVYRLYQRASLAGDLGQLGPVENAIDHAVTLLNHPDDLYLLKANIAFKLHRLGDAEAALLAMPNMRDSQEARLLLADLAFQRGQYREAEAQYCKALEPERSWGALARLAHFRGRMEDPVEADRLYREAEDELTAKEMRFYAWLKVQQGILAFTHGDYREARARYERAETAYPGYWLVQEYFAELLGAEGRHREAIDILEGVCCIDGRPDLQQAIGELCEISGQIDRAAYWQRTALAGYLQSAERGEVHFLHHLSDYSAEVAKDGAAAVAWARADMQLREFLDPSGSRLGAIPQPAVQRGPRVDRSGSRLRRGRSAPVPARGADLRRRRQSRTRTELHGAGEAPEPLRRKLSHPPLISLAELRQICVDFSETTDRVESHLMLRSTRRARLE
jgi:Flp pilus assembly protein TadD